MCVDNKYAKKNTLIPDESRNQHFKKAKSISQENNSNINFEAKPDSQAKKNLNMKQMMTKINDKSALSMSQSMFDEILKNHKALSKMSSQKESLKLHSKAADNEDYCSIDRVEKRNSISLSSSAIYRNQDSRHFYI